MEQNTKTKWKKRLSGLAFLLMILTALGGLVMGVTRKDRTAERELPYYCMYRYEDEISVSVVRKNGALVETVVCQTQRAEENAPQIGWRSMVYWGYRGALPFPSTYAYGEEEPKMLQAQKDNYQRAKTFQMFGRDYSVEIFVADPDGNILWQKNWHP